MPLSTSGDVRPSLVNHARKAFMHLPIRKQIVLSMRQSPELATEFGLEPAAAVAVKEEACDRRFRCRLCCRQFSTDRKHRAHERRHVSKEQGRYRCTKCSKCFVQKSSLDTHVRIHTGERPYACKSCGVAFGDFSSYRKHLRVHSGARPFSCSVCGHSFTQSGNLYRHMRTRHADNKPS